MNASKPGDNLLIETKQFRRFVEFCKCCAKERYIGICYGPPGVGKTYSAREYSKWQQVEDYFESCFRKKPVKAKMKNSSTIFLTAGVSSTARMVHQGLELATRQLYYAVLETVPKYRAKELERKNEHAVADLLIVDEADRLKLDPIEQIRDFHDKYGVGLILMGMPGIEKRLSRYPQLYSRVGFVHEFKPLANDEVRFILESRCADLGLAMNDFDFTDQEALASITRITNGNFRLLLRLISQTKRIMEINQLHLLTREVVETARDSLIIGQN